jgi:tRNA(His) 5'-end guanylyltransferase
MKEAIGTRMKEFYENRCKYLLPRKTYTVIRVDGKAFHTYTRGLKRPFDIGFIEDMNETAKYMCAHIQGAKFAFVQSDEISIALTDMDTIQTQAWFDGEIQKIVSVSASMATSCFNRHRYVRHITSMDDLLSGDSLLPKKDAEFDSRVFTIPNKIELINYFIWRQQDTVRNSISSVAQSLYSHRELNGKNTNAMQEMCLERDVNWNNFEPQLKRGRLVVREKYTTEGGAIRHRWVVKTPPTFSKDLLCLDLLLP